MTGQGRADFVGRERELALLTDRLRAAADEDGNPPYWPFRQLIKSVVRSAPAAAMPADLAAVAGGTESAAEDRFRVFEAVTDFLVTAAEPNGLVVVLDDL